MGKIEQLEDIPVWQNAVARELKSQLYILYKTNDLPSNEEYEIIKAKLLEISRQLSGSMKYLQEPRL